MAHATLVFMKLCSRLMLTNFKMFFIPNCHDVICKCFNNMKKCSQ